MKPWKRHASIQIDFLNGPSSFLTVELGIRCLRIHAWADFALELAGPEVMQSRANIED